MSEKFMPDELILRKKPKRQHVKDFLASSEAFLFELSVCDSALAKQLHRELDNVVSRIRMYYER